MKEKKTMNKNGVGFCGLLTIAFIVLKLCGVIDWAWVWVLAPLWINLGLVLVIIAVVGIAKLIHNRVIDGYWYL